MANINLVDSSNIEVVQNNGDISLDFTNKGLVLPQYAQNLNDIGVTGMTYYNTGSTNTPTNYGVVYTLARERQTNVFWVYQIAFDAGGGIYKRQCINDLTLNSWTPWKPDLATDSGWQDITLQNGFTARTGDEFKPQYRKIGNVVYVKGQVTIPSHNSTVVMCQLPSGYRPICETRMPIMLTSVNNWIGTDGNFNVTSSSQLNNICIDAQYLVN